MGSPAKRINRKYTWNDYTTWPDGERWEIIDGEAYDMTPAPTTRHQQVAGRIFQEFAAFFKGKPCIPFYAPTDVVFDEFNIVQPDILVVCDRKKITEANIQGAPDLVVEILSPATALKDIREKKALYERSGVREYLIVHPVDEIVERYTLREQGYGVPDVFGWDETMSLAIFPELDLHLWEAFGKEPPENPQPAVES